MSNTVIQLAEQTIDFQFKKLMGEYIETQVVPLASAVKAPKFDSQVYVKRFTSKYQTWNSMSAYQCFILELDCLSRINCAMQSRNKTKHFPILVDFDLNTLTITISNNGNALNKLKEPFVVKNLSLQIEEIFETLKQAKVIHLDMVTSGKNVVVNKEGILTIIDFNMAQANGYSFNHCVEKRILDKTYTLTKECFLDIIKKNKNIEIVN